MEILVNSVVPKNILRLEDIKDLSEQITQAKEQPRTQIQKFVDDWKERAKRFLNAVDPFKLTPEQRHEWWNLVDDYENKNKMPKWAKSESVTYLYNKLNKLRIQ
jgi:predicted transcriptional regulator